MPLAFRTTPMIIKAIQSGSSIRCIPCLLLFTFAICIAVVPALVAPVSLSQQQRLSNAMKLSTLSVDNITQAHEACVIWDELLSTEPERELPEHIRAICFALQASCLARVGRDDSAIQAYDACLALKHVTSAITLHDAMLGKGFALQRLMQYEDARNTLEMACCCDEHLDINLEKAICSAVTCSLRLGDADWALDLLQRTKQFYQQDGGSKELYYEARGMLGTLLYLCNPPKMAGNNKDTRSRGIILGLLRDGSKISPLYKWIYAVLTQRYSGIECLEAPSYDTTVPPIPMGYLGSYLSLAATNISPFDDASLIQLDDKILLHELMTASVVANANVDDNFWPRGFVLPGESIAFEEYAETLKEDTTIGRVPSSSKPWILKQRAGYGSHGNQLVSSSEAIIKCGTGSSSSVSDPLEQFPSRLCQRMVDPPLLIGGRKFTIRVYVVSFVNSPHVYISREGLVKLASALYAENTNDENVHMTNSGRETSMLQYDLQYLRTEFANAGWSYKDFWSDIQSSLSQVMKAYNKRVKLEEPNKGNTSLRENLASLGIPKVMGLDYILDGNRKPWLLEVNRFPGLEARDASDEAVKRGIIRDAWMCASKTMGVSFGDFAEGIFEEDTHVESSLDLI